MTTGIDTRTNQKIPPPSHPEAGKPTTQNMDEQITLSSSDFDQFKDDSNPQTITAELTQEVRIKEHFKLFRIYDDRFINVNEKTASNTVSYIFKLSLLDPKPQRKRVIKLGHLLGAAGLLALAWLTFSLKQLGLPLLQSPYAYTVITGFVATGLILLVYVIKEFKNLLVFYSEHGRAPVVQLIYRVPDKREFHAFKSRLIDCIRNQKSRNYYSHSQLLAAELSEHRKVRDAGGLSAKEYEAAKNNIMKCH